MRFHLLTALVLMAGCVKAKPEPKPADPPAAILQEYSEVSARLLSGFLEGGGWVVSRSAPNVPEHLGDSLIWSGLALHGLSCKDAAGIDTVLRESIVANDGALSRYKDWAGPVSVDGALGLYRGLASRFKRCSGTPGAWRDVLSLHCAYYQKNKVLGPRGANLGPFSHLLLSLAKAAKANCSVTDFSKEALESVVSGWALATTATKSAAYRIHLGWLTHETLLDLGEGVTEQGRDGFCGASAGADMPSVDNYCGRRGIIAWINQYKFNEWEYRLQRSGAWERPDGNGMQTPALDLLIGLKQGYNL